MNTTLSNVLTGILVVCALIVTGLLVHRELNAADSGETATQMVERWPSLVDASTSRTGTSAPVTIVKITDYECPFCAKLHGTLAELRKEYAGQIEIRYLHYPLASHEQARPAARAAECAAQQGRVAPFHDLLFSQSDLKTVSWSTLATQSGVPDIGAFETCVDDGATEADVADHMALVEEMGVRAVPQTIIEGEMIGGYVPVSELRALIDKHLES